MSQQGELEHRRVKRFYARTNKLRQFTRQITKHQRRERILHNIKLRYQQTKASATATNPPNTYPPPTPEVNKKTAAVPFEESESLPGTIPSVHYHMPESTKFYENITKFLTENANDAATEVSAKLEYLFH